ncbi:BZ3500_MvSof-1268-A1-R1_Chr9g10414 [Microbotryum saponariae]|uniref:BZ3500_MvSof-1268-A1-R1_Chr9g10414 protein n=1 Tax=Microbotryum saponariae TaxID=289078 RepID=A0A2X0L0L9_9BASI|nr:BZ3501_MvSof-1269-A2-R1_Chr9g10164 [Microbotryum saponariae]SDA00054.1 BZ3500_MvSof-1268-A1-R1_Chr9g10414 [Microbotryum saponariae]
MLLPSTIRALVLTLFLPYALAQISNLIYTYEGQSAPASVLQAISSAAAPAQSILNSQGVDTATGLVAAFPTTATVLDTVTAPAETGAPVFSSGSPGLNTATVPRSPYVASGTINLSLATSSSASATSKSPAGRVSPPSGLTFGFSTSVLTTVVGMFLGLAVTL